MSAAGCTVTAGLIHIFINLQNHPTPSHPRRPLPRNASGPNRPCQPTISAALAQAQNPSSQWLNLFFAGNYRQLTNSTSANGTWFVPTDAALKQRLALGTPSCCCWLGSAYMHEWHAAAFVHGSVYAPLPCLQASPTP